MLNPIDGVLHLIFGDLHDKYVLPSLVRLNMWSYICYQLRWHSCEIILRAAEKGNKIELEGVDEKAKAVIPQDSWLCRTTVAEKIEAILDTNQRVALVMDLSVLNRLHESDSGFVRRFIKKMDDYHRRNNMLVLTSTLDAECSLGILTSEDGPFAVEWENKYLCPQLQAVLQDTADKPLYDELCMNMDGRMRVLNYFDDEHLSRVVDNVLMRHCEWTISTDQQKALVEFLYFWNQFPAVQHWFSSLSEEKLLEENTWMSFSLLERQLMATQTCSRLLSTVEEKLGGDPKTVRARLEKICCQSYTAQPQRLSIRRSGDHLAARLGQITLPAEVGPETEQQFYELQQFYTTVRNHPCPGETKDAIFRSLLEMQEELSKDNLEYARDWVNCFHEYGMVFAKDPENTVNWFALLTTVLHCKKKKAELQRRKQKLTEQYEEEKKKAADMDRILKYRNTYDNKVKKFNAILTRKGLEKDLDNITTMELSLDTSINISLRSLTTGIMKMQDITGVKSVIANLQSRDAETNQIMDELSGMTVELYKQGQCSGQPSESWLDEQLKKEDENDQRERETLEEKHCQEAQDRDVPKEGKLREVRKNEWQEMNQEIKEKRQREEQLEKEEHFLGFLGLNDL